MQQSTDNKEAIVVKHTQGEDLLLPRYKIAHDYPGSPFRLNDIITFVMQDKDEKYFILKDQSEISEELFKQNPFIFRKLEWYEYRDPKIVEAVKYLKSNINGKVKEVVEYSSDYGYMSGHRNSFKPTNPEYSLNPYTDMRSEWMPATFEEFNNYNLQKINQ